MRFSLDAVLPAAWRYCCDEIRAIERRGMLEGLTVSLRALPVQLPESHRKKQILGRFEDLVNDSEACWLTLEAAVREVARGNEQRRQSLDKPVAAECFSTSKPFSAPTKG